MSGLNVVRHGERITPWPLLGLCTMLNLITGMSQDGQEPEFWLDADDDDHLDEALDQHDGAEDNDE